MLSDVTPFWTLQVRSTPNVELLEDLFIYKTIPGFTPLPQRPSAENSYYNPRFFNCVYPPVPFFGVLNEDI